MMLTPLSAQEIRTYRAEAGYTRRELAQELGYSVASIVDWERNDKKRRPMPRAIEARFLAMVNPRREGYVAMRAKALMPAA